MCIRDRPYYYGGYRPYQYAYNYYRHTPYYMMQGWWHRPYQYAYNYYRGYRGYPTYTYTYYRPGSWWGPGQYW